jgi:hypothetical protein
MHHDIIAGVRNHRQVARVHHPIKTEGEFRSAYAAGEGRNSHAQ